MRVKFALLLFLCPPLMSCSNLFTDLSDRDSNKAKLYDAKRALDRSDWTVAIEKLNSLSSTYLLRRDVRAMLASAYAGRCGMDFLNLVDAISNNTDPAATLFKTLMATMTDATDASIIDCYTAESTLNSIGVASDRTVDENLLMAFVQFGKIGAILNFLADVDGNNEFSTPGDAAFDPCQNTSLPESDTATSKASANQLVASLAILIEALEATSSTIAQDDLGDLQAICDQAGTVNDICSATDASAVTTDQRRTIRAIIRGNEVGFKIPDAPAAGLLCGS
ncbi:MAG TPA: hypothetical protein VFV50_13390 [Bdellovibrionales bacterium]|nr:hypothetical protein [Bdellovibrionales bacterium]